MRYFVTFKKGTSLQNNVMVFTNMTKSAVQDLVARNYGLSWHKIYSEPEYTEVFQVSANSVVAFGTICHIVDNKQTVGDV